MTAAYWRKKILEEWKSETTTDEKSWWEMESWTEKECEEDTNEGIERVVKSKIIRQAQAGLTLNSGRGL
jgi:hypothetical protein